MNDFRLSKSIRPSRYDLRLRLDLDDWSAQGEARIALSSTTATRELTLHAVDLDVTEAAIDGAVASATHSDTESQTVTFTFAKEIAAGAHELNISWRGPIAERLRGLYRSVRGGERYAVTQFEAADARRAFPCFDEPEFKARFILTLDHPADLAAVANAPILASEPAGGGRMRTRFAETPPISSYLVAFAVGPYQPTDETRTASGIPVRVWMPPGLADRAIYARDAHARAVAWLEDYTGIPYPYTKIDAIAIPDFEAGAMENPGAITYRVTLLQADRETASTATFKRVFSVAAHELTHMWWGDLVTMAWWTDLWLNESFASFVGEKCTAALNPEWGFLRDVVAQNGPAFSLDALVSTHPISVEARNADEAAQRFDAITYNKGQGVLRMIENFLGADAFRGGVRIYLQRHREANATADDFWRALGEASGRDVTTIANAWIKEPGHPLVSCHVRETDDGLEVEISQRRFFADPEATPTQQRWPVPLVFRFGTDGDIREERVLLEGERHVVRLLGARWYFPNGAGAGFYRFAFDDRSLELLASALMRLSPEERLALLDNQWALVRAKQADAAQYLRLLRGLEGERDRAVLQTIAEALDWLETHAVGARTEGAFRALVASIYRPVLDQLGWDVRANDSADDREARGTALRMLGHAASDAAVRKEARRRVEAHLDGSAKLDPEIAGTVVSIAAVEGDTALYERYVARMREASTSDAQEEARFRMALADFSGEGLPQRFADEVLTDLIRDQDRPYLFVKLLGGRPTRTFGWDALKRGWDTHVAKTDPIGKQRYVQAASQLTPNDLMRDAVAFLERKRTADIEETVAQSLERVRIASANAKRISEELERELA